MKLVVGIREYEVKKTVLKFHVGGEWLEHEDVKRITKVYDDEGNEITDYTDVELVGYLVQTGYLIPKWKEG